MDLQSKAHELMTALGPALDWLAVDEYEAESTWHMAVDEETFLFAELDKSRALLVLSATVSAPAGDRAELYERLLHYNHLWDSTGGVRLSIDEPGGEIWMLSDIAVMGIETEMFTAQVQDFASMVMAWRDIVSGWPGKQTADDDLSLQNMIRG